MRLFALGTAAGPLPPMPDEISEAWLVYPDDETVLDWCLTSGLSVTLVAKQPAKIDEAILDQVSDVRKSSNPSRTMLEEATAEDAFLLSWDDSTEMYEALETLASKGVAAQDLNDGLQQLVLQDPLEELLKAITESITRDVLRIVRAEIREQMQNLPRGRRLRSPKE